MYTIFEAYVINSLRFSEVHFSHFTPQVRLLFVEKGSLKFSESKNAMQKGTEKLSLSENFELLLKCSGK